MNRIGADPARSPRMQGAAEVPGLRIGASVVLRAVHAAPQGEWTVIVNGVRLNAAVSIPLTPGLKYSARADRLPERPGWVFHILGRAGDSRAGDVPRALDLGKDPVAVLALRALMAESLPLSPKNLSRLRAALSGREPSEERAFLSARALAKGLDPELLADALEGVESRSESGDGQGNGQGGGGEGAGKEDPQPEGAEAAGSWKDFPDSTKKTESVDDVHHLADLLRFLASRSSDKSNPFQLFNSRVGPKGRWIHVPYRFEREGVAFSGTLRILIPGDSRQALTVSADVLSGDDEGKRGRYGFAIRREGIGYRLSLSAEDASDRDKLSRSLESFRRVLGERNCSVEYESGRTLGDLVSEYEPVDDRA